MHGAPDGRLERENTGPGGIELGPRPRGIERRAPAALQARDGQSERLTLVVGVVPGDRELMLGPAQLEVIARHLGQQAHEDIVQGSLGGITLRGAGLNGAAHAAEEIELPERVEPNVVELTIPIRTAKALQGRFALLFIGIRSVRDDGRVAIKGGFVPQGPGLPQPCGGDAQIMVAGHREIHQPFELLILESLPPAGVCRIRRQTRLVGVGKAGG